MIVEDILFYLTVYVTLYISVFWLTTFFLAENKRPRKVSRLPPLTIIIPAYNAERLIAKCVDSLQNQDYPGLRVVVVDDGSTDNTGSVVKSLCKKYGNLACIKKKNGGKASALNAGLQRINTEIFGFIDSDTYLARNALKNMVGYFSGDVAAVTATTKPAKCENFVERLQKVEYMISSFTRKLLSFIDSLYYTPAFALYRTSVVKELGGFDEKNITEDLEIGLKLKSRGYKIENSVETESYTVVPATFSSLARQRLRWYRGYIYNSRKYSNMFFNRKFGDLGMLVLPLQYILLALVIPLMLIMISNLLISAAKWVADLLIVGFDVGYFAQSQHIVLITPTTYFSAAFLVSFAVMLSISFSSLREKAGKLDYIAYMAVYPLVNLVFWVVAIAHEILRTKREW